MCEKYILAQNDVESLSQIAWGGGWSQYKKEFDTNLRELTYLGYGIVFIAHSKTKATSFVDAEGESISSSYPDITKTGMNIVNRLVDVIGYLSVEFDEFGNSSRYLYTRQTPYVFAGSRYKYLEEKVPFGYQELVDAIADAIEKAITQDGVEATDHTKIAPEERQLFIKVQNEAKEMWLKLTANDNEENALAILASVKRHLGREAKISDITASQQDILELVVVDMKEMLKNLS